MIASGLCAFIFFLHHKDIFNELERRSLNMYLHEEIRKKKYSHFSIIYYAVNFSSSSIFFFKENDWTVRKKWLKEIEANFKTTLFERIQNFLNS